MKKAKPLEEIVEKQRVYCISEVGYDTCYFNAQAYDSLLEYMSRDKGLTGIIIDGPLTRLDRPEYLNEELSYWGRSEKECFAEEERIPNRRQYKDMMEKQLQILEKRLCEIKSKVPQAKKIVLSVDSDDLQYTVSAMVNEMLLRGQHEINESIKQLRGEKKELQARYKAAGSDSERSNLESKMGGIDQKIQNKTDEQKLYREKKVRPAHQYFTARFVKKLYGRFQEVCSKAGVELLTKPGVIDFDGMVVDYAHSRHSNWSVLKTRDRSLLGSVHGKAQKKKADVLLESGHSGIGYKQLQKLVDNPDENNFRNQSTYDPNVSDANLTVVMALPFEDQEKIGRFLSGDEFVRLSGGKAVNTRKHAVIDRQKNDGVSGLTVLTKDSMGVIGTEWIQYANFVTKEVLSQPKEYRAVFASSDEHIGSAEENPLCREGWVEYMRMYAENPQTFRGKKAKVGGYINAGDAAEANSRKWDHRYHYKRDPQEVLRENIELIKKARSLDDAVSLAMKFTNDSMGGSVENMSCILERVADYYDSILSIIGKNSNLKWLQVAVTGNHADNVLRDLGMRETDFFMQRLKARGIGARQVGVPAYIPEKGIERVLLGGYSNARIAVIPDYGKSVDGKDEFGPISLVVQHDPKGPQGLIVAGKNSGADLAIGGHTHENCMRLYRTGNNTFGVSYRVATLQGVSPTEKLYCFSLPRTQAAHCLVMPMKGDFSEKAIPVKELMRIGRDKLGRK